MRGMRSIALSLVLLGGSLAGCATSSHMRKTEQDGENLRVELAQTYMRKGAYDAALPLLKRALADKPKDPYLHTMYGTVLRERGLYPQAERELLSALAAEPKRASAWAEIGVLYDLERRSEEAEHAHRRAVELAPGNARYWNNLGFSLYVAGRVDDAIPVLERSLAIDPGMTVAYNNLGFAYGKKGAYKEAERSFRTAGGDAAVMVNMALVYEQNVDDATAAKLRAEAKAMDPSLEVK
jgi:Flp pilus assembly protein TadD